MPSASATRMVCSRRAARKWASERVSSSSAAASSGLTEWPKASAHVRFASRERAGTSAGPAARMVGGVMVVKLACDGTVQNIYDDPEFFAGYQEMRAAPRGLHETTIRP